MFVIDTNVLVYAVDTSSPHHATCRERIDGWRRGAGAWYLTWGICYEFLRVVTHPRVFRRPLTDTQAWAFLAALRASPSLGILTPTERHADVIEEVLQLVPHLTGNLWHDAETAALMREHGIRRLYTRDTDFHRFPFLEPLDPLTDDG
jgi:toxin-antitoxin system PIN domain toxin